MAASPDNPPPKHVAVVGAGLAGLAAALALGEQGLRVTLFESRPQCGGRASSFTDQQSGELVDNCQHVSMGCCTNLADFFRRAGIEQGLRRDPLLHFIARDGRIYPFQGRKWLPPPLHLAPGLMGLRYLSLRDRVAIGSTLMKLARTAPESLADISMADWLAARGASAAACEGFWSVVLTSALSESLPRISARYSRTVFVDGFMTHREAYELEAPQAPLSTLYGERLAAALAAAQVDLRMGLRVKRLTRAAGDGPPRAAGVELPDGTQASADAVVLAVPWHRVADLTGDLATALPEVAGAEKLEPAPITSVHLWFDRPITPLPHAILVGRLSQWVFARPTAAGASAGSPPGSHYYQVVISASHELVGGNREDLVARVRQELAEIWPAAGAAQLLHSRTVTEHSAVFAPLPGVDRVRPGQKTAVSNVFLAGDWTATGWPATMEGAVRSGRLAAEAVCQSLGRTVHLVTPDLPVQGLMRWLMR